MTVQFAKGVVLAILHMYEKIEQLLLDDDTKSKDYIYTVGLLMGDFNAVVGEGMGEYMVWNIIMIVDRQ